MASKFQKLLTTKPKKSWKTEQSTEDKLLEEKGYVTFCVESSKFYAHKEILAKASVVFAAMLFGHFREAEVKKPEIHIPDMAPATFRILLNIIYSGIAKLAKLTMEEALLAYYAIRKYNIVQEPDFLKMIQRNVNSGNALLVLPHAELYEWRIVKSKCWSIIERDTKKVVETIHFQHISWNILHEILENNRLTISEYDLFCGVQRWVAEERRRNPKLISNVDAIGVGIYKLRFPLMTRSEFELVVLSGFLRLGDLNDLLKNFMKNMTFDHKRRLNVCACRRLKRFCTLCNSNKPNWSVLGVCPTLEPNSTNNWTPKSFEIDANNNPVLIPISNDSDTTFICECKKYESCPAYPNGVSAEMLTNLEKEHCTGPVSK